MAQLFLMHFIDLYQAFEKLDLYFSRSELYIPAFLGHEGIAAGAEVPCIITAGCAISPGNSHGVKLRNNARLAAAQPHAVVTILGCFVHALAVADTAREVLQVF
jgi:hypothetical protein